MDTINKFKSFISNYDQVLIGIAVILILFGVYLQFNIATSLGDAFQMSLFINQLKSLAISIVVFLVVFCIPNLSNLIHKYSFFFITVVIGLLVFVLVYGVTTQGSTRWIRLPFFSFQPSQLAHPILIIFYAKYFEKKKEIIPKTGFFKFIKNFKPLIIITLTIFALIYLERHLSTLVVLALTLWAMLFIAEFKKSLLVMLFLLLLGSFWVSTNLTHGYRSTRMEIYSKYSLFHKALGIDIQEIEGDSYQIRESLTAISQGGLFGTGSEGGRAKHMFLPDVNSDYIFAMIGEQFGFFGGLIIILLFSILLFRSMLMSSSSKSYFDMLVIMGMGVNIFITAAVNIGVSLSALPSTGLTLPFISYGGSAMVVNIGMLAVMLNIGSKKRITL
ncbi:MAG: FtsW/RodA/SpoVE family cell cycle protein [Candidatus Cloacimonetes bacterium]|nr:FtsW/RodA/SpoVE family cell cycle protein [Candidatus Cloacimonadota bacterium]